MLKATAGARRIVTYSAYEKTRINELKALVPELAGPLEELLAKLVDLLPVVRNNVYHPDFRGSFSLKYVLTPLVPDLDLQRPGDRRRAPGQRRDRATALRGPQDPGAGARPLRRTCWPIASGIPGHGPADGPAPGAQSFSTTTFPPASPSSPAQSR